MNLSLELTKKLINTLLKAMSITIITGAMNEIVLGKKI
jgi:hypothetical protein